MMRCDECRFWDSYDEVEIAQGLTDDLKAAVLASGGRLTKTIGICHRYPPSNESRFDENGELKDDGGGFPWTDDKDWCGEFRPKESEPESQHKGPDHC